MSSHRILSVELVLYDTAASQGGDLLDLFDTNAESRDLFAYVASLCERGRGAVGRTPMGIVVRSLGVNLPAPATSFTCTRASWTAGDILRVATPGGEWVDLVATASPNYSAGQYGQGAATDTDLAAEVVKAVNQNPRLWKWCTATNSTNTVTLTARGDTADLNGIKLVKVVTTAGVFSFTSGVAFTGGLAALDSTTTATVQLDELATANDTLVIGPVTLTWKASAANENEVTIGANTTVAATNLAAAINAHSILKNFVVATSATDTVTVRVVYASMYTKTWTITKTGTYTPILAGSLFPSTVTVQGADTVRAFNIR